MNCKLNRKALSLLELLAAISIMGVLAILVIPRLHSSGNDCKVEACSVNCHTIEIQALLWRRQNGAWPAMDLGDLGGSKPHFPEGLPTCPVDESSYQLDSNGRVIGHQH